MSPTNTPRLKSFDYRGMHRYSVTVCTFRRQAIFVSADIVNTVLTQSLHAAMACECAILAYCFMPDHIHLLVEWLSATTSLSRFMQLAKQLSGHAFLRFHHHLLWQSGYYDRVLRREEDTAQACACIWGNPVRAGLVEQMADYAYSGSAVLDYSLIVGRHR